LFSSVIETNALFCFKPGDGGEDPSLLAVDPDPALDPYLLLAIFSTGFELPDRRSSANLSSFQKASQIDS
jgi:hypothetical protein